MGKRLIIILALALVVSFVACAYAEVQNVKVSGDLTVYGMSRELSLRGRRYGTDNVYNSLASIARIKVDADLTDNVIATVRLLNERYWGTENENMGEGAASDNIPTTDISLDLGYVTLKEFLYSPLTLTVGRQELHFGNGMIVGDVDTNNAAANASPFGNGDNRDADLSARKAFDAIRITLNYDPLVIDAIMAKVTEASINKPDDVNLFGVNVNYALNKTTTLEGYWFEKDTATDSGTGTSGAVVIGTKHNTVDTLGARLAAQPMTDLNVSLEGAVQLGKYYAVGLVDANGQTVGPRNRRAYGAEGAVNYALPKLKRYSPNVGLVAGYFSGEARNYLGDTNKYRAWDPMFEDQTFGNIANALFDMSNVELIGANVSVKPMDDITVKGEYFYYWWDKHYLSTDAAIPTIRDSAASLEMTTRKQAAQEFDLTGVYNYTEDVQFSLLYGMLFPGKSFTSASRHTATELIGSMKVTF